MSNQLPQFDRLNPARGHRAYVRSVAVVPGNPPRVVTAGYDGTVRACRNAPGSASRPLPVRTNYRSGGLQENAGLTSG